MNGQQQPPADFQLQLYICQCKKQNNENIVGNFYTWSTILEFNRLISDPEAMTLVKLAYGEMVTKSSGGVSAYISKNIPGAMTALIIPTTTKTIVILASSMRKKSRSSLKQSYYLYSNQRLKEAVDKVSLPGIHNSEACGELVAYHVWSRSTMYGSGNKPNIITWGIIENKVLGLKPPCSELATGGRWGCLEFVSANDIIPIAIPQAPSLETSLPTFQVLDHPGFDPV